MAAGAALGCSRNPGHRAGLRGAAGRWLSGDLGFGAELRVFVTLFQGLGFRVLGCRVVYNFVSGFRGF